VTDSIALYKRSACPQSSPWGKIQETRELAPGIWTVSTAGHGGVKLSRERNAGMPDYMRNEGGWYEEDCEWAKVAVVYPIGFQRVIKIEGRPDKTEFDYAMETFRNWHPDQYERFSGIHLEPGQSLIRDEQVFKAETHDKFVLASAWGDWAHWVPKGKVGVCARRASDKVEKYFLLDGESYTKRRASNRSGIVIYPNTDTEIEKPENP
jgi:hypothetical protein